MSRGGLVTSVESWQSVSTIRSAIYRCLFTVDANSLATYWISTYLSLFQWHTNDGCLHHSWFLKSLVDFISKTVKFCSNILRSLFICLVPYLSIYDCSQYSSKLSWTLQNHHPTALSYQHYNADREVDKDQSQRMTIHRLLANLPMYDQEESQLELVLSSHAFARDRFAHSAWNRQNSLRYCEITKSGQMLRQSAHYKNEYNWMSKNVWRLKKKKQLLVLLDCWTIIHLI